MKKVIKLNETELKHIITNTIRKLISEVYDANNTVTFFLYSKANGNLQVTVPYNEFINQKYKIDYLWKKIKEQYPQYIKYVGNGYFQVNPQDKHANEPDVRNL